MSTAHGCSCIRRVVVGAWYSKHTTRRKSCTGLGVVCYGIRFCSGINRFFDGLCKSCVSVVAAGDIPTT